MIRIIGVSADAGMAANVGGPVHLSHRSFDIEFPALEVWLAAAGGYLQRSVQGVEVVEPTAEDTSDASQES